MKIFSVVGRLKYPIILTLLVSVCVFAVWYNFDEFMARFHSDRYRQMRLEQIAVALQHKDAERIKDLLSQAVIDACGETSVDEDIQYLFSVFKGNMLTCYLDGGGRYGGEYAFGKRRLILGVNGVVITDQGKYIIYIDDYCVDTITPDHRGINSLLVLSEEDNMIYRRAGASFGIFRPDLLGDVDLKRADVILKAFSDMDADAILNMFSKAVIKEAGAENLKQKIASLFPILEGKTSSFSRYSTKFSRTILDGKKYTSIQTEFEIETNEEGNGYMLFLRENLVDELDADNIGLEKLALVRRDLSFTTSYRNIGYTGVYQGE